MSWKSVLIEAIVKKSDKRLSREWIAAGAERTKGKKTTSGRVLKLIRKAGVKPGMEGKTYRRNKNA